MISFVSGRLVEKSVNQVVIENNGIGYSMMISNTTYQALPEQGGNVRLHTYLQLSQQSDQPNLFGFSDKEEKELFLTLISISGIGAKGAIKILSGISPRRFTEVIAREDVAFLTRLPGIGKKSAQRIIVELREKLPALVEKKQLVAGMGTEKTEEAMQALGALGLSSSEARKALERVVESMGAKKVSELTAEDLIRQALTVGR